MLSPGCDMLIATHKLTAAVGTTQDQTNQSGSIDGGKKCNSAETKTNKQRKYP